MYSRQGSARHSGKKYSTDKDGIYKQTVDRELRDMVIHSPENFGARDMAIHSQETQAGAELCQSEIN